MAKKRTAAPARTSAAAPKTTSARKVGKPRGVATGMPRALAEIQKAGVLNEMIIQAPQANDDWASYFDQLRSGRVPTTDGYHWYSDVVSTGVVAVAEAAMEVANSRDLTMLPVNLLATVTAAISLRVRGAMLLRCLERTGWNLTYTAEILRMGSNPSVVIREIKALGLDAAYARAKRDGLVFRSGHRTRTYQRDLDHEQRTFLTLG